MLEPKLARRSGRGVRSRPPPHPSSFRQPVGMVRGHDRAAIAQPAPQAVEVPGGEIGDLGPAGAFGRERVPMSRTGSALAAEQGGPDQARSRSPPPGCPRACRRRAPVSSPAADLDTSIARRARARGPAPTPPPAGPPPSSPTRPRSARRSSRPRGRRGRGRAQDDRHHHPAEVALVHHVAGIEAGVEEVAAEGGLVAPLVGEEAAGRRALGEHPAHGVGEVDRLPPAVRRDEGEGGELDVLEQQAAGTEQAGQGAAEGVRGAESLRIEGGGSCAGRDRGGDAQAGPGGQPAFDRRGGVRSGPLQAEHGGVRQDLGRLGGERLEESLT